MLIWSRTRLVALVACALMLTLTSCGAADKVIASITGNPATIVMSPVIASIGVGASQQFTATVGGGAVGSPAWGFYYSSANTGTVTQNGFYTAPPTPPIYGAVDLASGAKNGTVKLSVNVGASGNTAGDAETFVITGTVSVGVAPATVSVVHGGTQQFTGYAVGSVNSGLTWQVNGVTGGGTAMGTVSATGLYTAPGTVPITGNPVTVTAVSQADGTKSASAAVTVT